MADIATRPVGTYERLGIRRVINACATLTSLGGSIMPLEVRQAMVEAGDSFVDIVDLQRAVSARVAELTHNEAAYVTSGAAAGLSLVTAALITGTDEAKAERLPLPDGPKYDVLIHTSHRFGYDHAIRMVGVNLVEFGPGSGGARLWELEAAYSDRTLAVIFLAGLVNEERALPLEDVVASAHRRNIPVIVDAAAQLPPPENLWRYTQERGADIVIFSGGKGLQGPQPTGLVLGKKSIIDGIYVNASPNANIGRPMKVGKEELAGLLAALEWYLRQDHAAIMQSYEAIVGAVVSALNGKRAGVSARRDFPSEAGQPMPRARIDIDVAKTGTSVKDVVNALRDGDPSIIVAGGRSAIFVNPQTLKDGEETVVIRRLAEVLEIG